MKKLLPLFIFLVQLMPSVAQVNTNENELYVINIFGAEVFESPSLTSKVLTTVPLGEKVLAKQILKTEEAINVGEGFFLEGDFVKVQYKTYTGYIFTSDLSSIKPSLKRIYEGVVVADILGEETAKRTEIRKEVFNNKTYEIEDEITEYENGKYIYTAFDGCFDHIYQVENLSLSEVYHQMLNTNYQISHTENGYEIIIPTFAEKVGNEYHFHKMGATQDLKITDNKDGTFTISSYDCT